MSLGIQTVTRAPAVPELRTSRDLVEAFDAALGKGRGALQGTTDAHLMTSWKLLAGGRLRRRLAHIDAAAFAKLDPAALGQIAISGTHGVGMNLKTLR